MHGLIYQYTNTLSGLVYVGQTINPQSRQRDYTRDVASTQPNPRLIIQAMRHAGLESFTYQVLAEASTKDDLNRLEIHYIAALQANNPLHGYNRSIGGESGTAGLIRTDRDKQHKQAAALRYWSSPKGLAERAQRSLGFSGANNPRHGKVGTMAGKVLSDEAKQTLSQKAKVRFQDDPTCHPRYGITMTEETKAKIGHGNRGKVRTPEVRQQISQSLLGHTSSDRQKQRARETFAKTWEVTFPNGTTQIIVSLARFCRDHDLNASNLSRTAHGLATHHKGFTCRQIPTT